MSDSTPTGAQAGPPQSPARYDDDVDLIDYIAVLLRQRWLGLVVTVLGGVAGLSYLARRSVPTYVAEVNILLEKAGRGFDGSEVLKPQVLRGYVIGRMVLDARLDPGMSGDASSSEASGEEGQVTVEDYLGKGRLATERQRLSQLNDGLATEMDGEGLLAIRYTSPDSAAAAGIANAFLAALRTYLGETRQRLFDQELAYLQSRLSEVETDLRVAEDSLLAYKIRHRSRLDESRYLELERELGWRQRRLDSWVSVYDGLMSRIEATRLEARLSSATTFQVLNRARVEPAASPARSAGEALAIGLSVGAFLGVLLAFVVEFLSRAVRDPRLAGGGRGGGP